jgi:hypothetical protein
MAKITIEAHAIDAAFEESIQENFGVTVVDRTNEPWGVVFEGEPSKIVEMVGIHWDTERAYQIADELRRQADSRPTP